jgi:spermidine synthase
LALGGAALLLAGRHAWRGGVTVAAGTTVLATGILVIGGENWRHVMSSGVFRARETEFNAGSMAKRKQHTKMLFYKDAPDATVSVEESDGQVGVAQRSLRINGKTDATSSADLSTQLLAAHVPMIARPGAKDVFILGLGSGISAGALLLYPLERVDVAENCAPVVQATKYFEDWNRQVTRQPRAHIWNEDARTVLKLRPQQYDVIITEPSNPWTVGVGSVFSQEFYQLAASRLKPGGLVAQWFHVYEMHDGIVSLVLRTFGSVFPFMEIWDTGPGDILIIGSQQPWRSDVARFRAGYAVAGVASDLAGIGIDSPEMLLARQLASQRTAFAIVDDGPFETDFFPVLEHVAPEAFFIGNKARLLSPYDERTYQQRLAPAEKQTVLRGLPEAAVLNLFGRFQSVNEEMAVHLFAMASATNTPCILRSKREPSLPSPSRLDPAVAALNSGDLAQAARLVSAILDREPDDAEANYVGRIVERTRQLRDAMQAPARTPHP